MNEINSVGKNKGTKLLRNGIIIISILIVLLLVVFVVLYFCTDLLKSDKQLFFKYASQLVETEGGFVENNIEAFYNKKQQMPYENEGKFDFTVDLGNNTNEQIDIANDFVVNFSGKTDKTNNKAEQNIELKYSDDVSWPLIYRHDGDIYGIQTDYVSSKYVAVENNNLKEFAEKVGMTDTSDVPEKIEILEDKANFEYTEEEKQTVQEKYMTILENQFRDDQFQTEKNDDGTTRYILTMTNEELKNLVIALLNELKTDDVTLGKINNILSEQDLYTKNTIEAEDIDSIIESLQEGNTEEGEVQFIVAQKDSKLISISLNQNDNNIQLTKNNQEDSVNYSISVNFKFDTGLSSVETIGGTVYFSANYSGLNELNTVKENYELGIAVQDNNGQQVGKYTYQFENNVNFVDSVNIDGLNEENAMILNNYEEESIQNFMTQLGERISNVNAEQMEKIGFNYGNPMILMIPTSLGNVLLAQNLDSTISESNIEISEVQTFNNLFLKYEGNQRGTLVKSLIQEIENSNDNNESQVELEFSGLGLIRNEDLALAGEYIDNSNTYEISFEYDDTGRINKVVIAGEFNGLESR